MDTAQLVIPELEFSQLPGLRNHDVVLFGNIVKLRPLTEDDWGYLLPWCNDPDVMALGNQGGFKSATTEDVQAHYRHASTRAYCFMLEAEDRPIGECRLQEMDLARIIGDYPDQQIHRIDVMIGEKHLWGHGYGSEAIRLLTRFGFEIENSHAIFAVDILNRNIRSIRAFRRNGFHSYSPRRRPAVASADRGIDLVINRSEYETLAITALA